VSFGSIAQTMSSSAQAITLTNTGTAVLSISGIAASGDFSQTNTCGGTLAVNATCQVSIIFTPTAIGQRTGTLTMSDNATCSPQTVTLSGAGVQLLTLGVGTGGSTTTTVAGGQAATLQSFSFGQSRIQWYGRAHLLRRSTKRDLFHRSIHCDPARRRFG
jgi:hypothetical protein